MFIKYEKKKNKNGEARTFVRVVEGYRVGNIIKQRSIKSYGYLEDQENQKLFIQNIEKEIVELEKLSDISIHIKDEDNKNNSKLNTIYNYGYKYLESIYDSLKIDDFFDDYEKKINKKIEYKLKDIFKFFTIQRILNPESKRASLAKVKNLYKKEYTFTLDDSYRSFDLMAKLFDEYQTYLRKELDKLIPQNYERVFYDVTNYYCEIDLEDDENNLRHRGVSKEHRVDPIVGLGLFMDSNGLPIQIKVFNGNTSESKTFIPGIEELKKKYNKSKIIVVADKGLNTSSNVKELIKNKDGYVFSQIIRGPKGVRYQKELLDENGWIVKSSEYKYKLYIEEINGIKQKVLLYFNQKEYELCQRKREEKIEKAIKSLTNNAYGIKHSYEKYLKEGILNEETGEYYTSAELKKFKELDLEKIKEDEKYDGYFCLITSELNYSEENIRKYYHDLWQIEETFRITKSDLEFRPIYHYKKEHIMVHFMICYTSLLILRLFQYKLKQNDICLSVERIVAVLNNMNLDCPSNGIVHLHSITGKSEYNLFYKTTNNHFSGEDELWKDYILINTAFGLHYDKAFDKEEKFYSFIKSILFHTTSA